MHILGVFPSWCPWSNGGNTRRKSFADFKLVTSCSSGKDVTKNLQETATTKGLFTTQIELAEKNEKFLVAAGSLLHPENNSKFSYWQNLALVATLAENQTQFEKCQVCWDKSKFFQDLSELISSWFQVDFNSDINSDSTLTQQWLN